MAAAREDDDRDAGRRATAPQIDSPPFQISNAPTTPPSLHL